MIAYIREGSSSYGTILFNIDTETGFVRAGSSSIIGEVVFNINNNKIRAGSNPYGTVVFTLDGKYLRSGDGVFSTIAYYIDGSYIRKGDSIFGTVVANITRS